MGTDLMDLYQRASGWTGEQVAGVTDLDAATPCDEWRVATCSITSWTRRYFVSTGRGEDASPPGPTPPDTLSSDPAAD